MAKRRLFNSADFAERVLKVVRAIPKGQVMSYVEVATKAGAPRNARQVARVMSNNYLPEVPCHRVIRADGGLGGYNRGGVQKKKALLLAEGYTVMNK
jgi:O-6-methylguanine DNA methyltransferase